MIEPVSTNFAELARRIESVGLAVRGAFHPEPDEFAEWLAGPAPGTIVLVGFTGSAQWPAFQASGEARDGLPDPLDRWSRRVLGALGAELQASCWYPSGALPQPPFQRLALRSEPVHRSPIGLLIHPQWGLWHAYRGALGMADRLALPAFDAAAAHPCDGCVERPCLHTCPVAALRSGSLEVHTCAAHVQSAAGRDCRELGCRARRACPLGAQYRYCADQARFHMQSFLRALKSAAPRPHRPT
jgi:hypothetical protein